MKRSDIIYQFSPRKRKVRRHNSTSRLLGVGLLALALGGVTGPLLSPLRLEGAQLVANATALAYARTNPPMPIPKAVPVIFDPLKTPDGASIAPINTEFSLIVPKIGINAEVIPAVNPAKPGEYLEALEKGVAHASTSYFPDENGTVYLFSHSTNYDWFVRDLNAVFYLLKNLETGDLVVLFYKGARYTYKLTDKQIVAPTAVSFLVPQPGAKRLILQTCWPPGSTTERLLLFAELIEEETQSI
jgi:LPXTG-site transpeptidase (sortase) family protein